MDSVKPHSFRVRLLIGLLGLLVAVVLYLLSYGPVAYLENGRASVPAWVEEVYRPYFWLAYNTPLQRPLIRYWVWWINRAYYHRHREKPHTPIEMLRDMLP